MVLALALALAGATAPLLVEGCSDDDPSRPVRPTPNATIENIWPNADSLEWTYAYREAAADSFGIPDTLLYTTPEQVPPAPSLDEVIPFLVRRAMPDSDKRQSGVVRLRFEGMETTTSGVVAQHLAQTRFGPQEAPAAALSRARFDDAFLRRLWLLRPDLREKIRDRRKAISESREEDEWLGSPLFLRDAAFEKTDEYIGAYGNLNRQLSWLFLEADLTAGHAFTFQLVPDLADNVFLHAQIVSNGEDFRTGFGTFAKTVRCAYLVDYGASGLLTPEGGELGYFGTHDSGIVVYAPMVGPIYDYEVHLAFNGLPEEEAYAFLEQKLIGSNVPWLSD